MTEASHLLVTDPSVQTGRRRTVTDASQVGWHVCSVCVGGWGVGLEGGGGVKPLTCWLQTPPFRQDIREQLQISVVGWHVCSVCGGGCNLSEASHLSVADPSVEAGRRRTVTYPSGRLTAPVTV